MQTCMIHVCSCVLSTHARARAHTTHTHTRTPPHTHTHTPAGAQGATTLFVPQQVALDMLSIAAKRKAHAAMEDFRLQRFSAVRAAHARKTAGISRFKIRWKQNTPRISACEQRGIWMSEFENTHWQLCTDCKSGYSSCGTILPCSMNSNLCSRIPEWSTL